MKVLLIAMPFGRTDRPSIALGLLKAALVRDGTRCDVAYLNLPFAERLGARRYELVVTARQKTLAGDWAFAGCLQEDGPPPRDDYVEQVLRAEWQLQEDEIEAVVAARALAPQLLERSLSEVHWTDYDLVGFTCSFGQTVPALALARLVKRQHPQMLTAFGGPTWHDVMGKTLFTAFPFVDVACLGEGDLAFPALVRELRQGDMDAARALPGMLVRGRDGEVSDGGTSLPPADLDQLPIPDYDDYLSTLAARAVSPDGSVVVPVETSRGCPWSVRGGCRFCGIVGPYKSYRTKSAERILEELRVLAAVPGCRRVDVVDNVAAPALLTTVLPQLAQGPLAAHLSIDIRPEIGRRTVEVLAETGTEVLTGIESVSDGLLTLMNKGSSALQHVRLLKWGKELGVHVRWNLLHGFPGETAEDYEELMSTLHAITHLDAPLTCATVEVERFSSYHEDPEAFGFAHVRPARAYRYIFPFDDATLGDIAYFFDHDFAPGREPYNGSFELRRFVYNWQRARAQDVLLLEHQGVVVDSRRPGRSEVHELDALESALFAACDDIRTRAEMEEDLRRSGIDGEGLGARIDAALDRFVEHSLMLRRGDAYLSLALPGPARLKPDPGSARPGERRARLPGG